MDLSEFIPLFSGVRKLFQPGTYGDPGIGGTTQFPGSSPNQQPTLQPSIGQAVSGDQSGGLDDQISQITKLLLDRLNKPDENVTRLNDLYNQIPQRPQPGFMRSLFAHALGSDIGAPAGSAILNGDYKRKVADWAIKNKAAEQIANTDIKGQHDAVGDTIRSLGTAITNERTNNQATFDKQKSDLAMQKLTQDLDLTKQKLEIEKSRADTYGKSVEGTLREKDLQLQAAALQRQFDNMLHQQQFGELVRNHNLENAAKDAAGWSQPFKVKDPNDPTQEIQMSFNLRTGQSRKLTADDQVITGDISKPLSGSAAASGAGGGLTNQTKQMMEFSQMLYPHIDEVRKQAEDLERRGLFGPVMSRVAGLAAKIGTTGDAGKVQQNFENFKTAIANDRQMPNDAAVGQFLTTLGLLSSGAGRAHGGMRGGGSIQLINYMKALLSSNASLSMFKGNLAGLDSYIKQYAAGPPKPKVPTGLDKAIEDVLKGIK